jgi:hypothetical protein
MRFLYNILLMSVPVLYSASALMLVTSQMATAEDHLLKEEALDELAVVCREFRHPEGAAQSSGLRRAAAGDNVAQLRRMHQPLAEEKRRVELQVPVALLQALQTPERDGTVVELHVPTALLTHLQTADLEDLP